MSNYPIWRKYAYEKEPDIKLLEKALENDGLLVDKEHSLKAIELKYQAMTTEPTIIEKTMSPEQLFNARNPETHYGQADIPFKNCMIGSNIANHLMAMTE